MKKILLMFVVLITSIANAQEFYFGCNTIEEEIAAFYATTDAPPTELHPLIKTEASKSGINNFTESLIPKLNKFGEVFTNYGNEKLTFTTVVVNAAGIGVSANSGRRRAVVLDIMTKIWIVGHPDYIIPGSVEDKIAMMYEADTPPTEFDSVINDAAADAYLNNNDIRKAFASKFDKYDLTFDTFEQRSDNKHYAVYTNDDIPGIVLPGDGTTFNEANFKLWMLEIAKAVWLHGHPLYDADAIAFSNALEAIYASDVYPTELGTIINDAALSVEYAGTVGHTPRTNFMKSLAYFDVSVDFVFNYPDKPSEVELSNGNVVPNIGTNSSINNMNPAQFAVFALEVVKRFWSIGHPEAAVAAKRAERIAEIAILSDASANVIITDYIDPDDGDTFIFNVLGDPNLQPEYNTTTYQGGVKSFGGLGTTQWGNMKSDISDKITEINDDVTERNVRINVLVQNSTTDVIVGARWSSLRGDLFDIDNGQTTVQIYANDYDLPLVVDGYTRLENLTHDEYSTLDAAIALKVGDLDPANAIYGFTPTEFAAATLNEKVIKAYDIGKANDDIQAVSGSLLTGVFSGDKITIRVGARNYPLNILTEMAHDADYEGWKTFIDRILYLVKTGDGSERTTRENHINGIAGNISVQDLDGGDDDWAVSWNELPFIYGGSDENDHNTNYDEHGNTSRVFAGYHQDNIGLLPGIIYEALLVEIDRINGYVIAADALPKFTPGGSNGQLRVSTLQGLGASSAGNPVDRFVLNSDVTVWSSSNFGPICEGGYTWVGQMDNYSFRYMYIIIRNELLRNDDSIRYYNNVNQNIYCL